MVRYGRDHSEISLAECANGSAVKHNLSVRSNTDVRHTPTPPIVV